MVPHSGPGSFFFSSPSPLPTDVSLLKINIPFGLGGRSFASLTFISGIRKQLGSRDRLYSKSHYRAGEIARAEKSDSRRRF